MCWPGSGVHRNARDGSDQIPYATRQQMHARARPNASTRGVGASWMGGVWVCAFAESIWASWVAAMGGGCLVAATNMASSFSLLGC